MDLHPGPLWRRMKRLALVNEVSPKVACRRSWASENVYWFHDRERGVLLGWRPSDDDLSVVRLLPTSVGSVTASASSEQTGFEATKAFDGNPGTSWSPVSWDSEAWLQGALASPADVDSVQLEISAEGLAHAGVDWTTRRRGIRIRPSSHQDTTKTAATICTELVNKMVAYHLNRAYIFAYEMSSFWFDTGTSDYTPFGSDNADFLATFIPIASAQNIEVYACLPYLQNYAYGLANDKGLELQSGGVYSHLWLCPNKSGVLTWYDGIITTLLTYNIDGVDFAEPQWGFAWGTKVCWCSECQAAFTAAHPGERFGEPTPEGIYSTDEPTITTWGQWRADVLTAALTDDIADVQTAGKTASVVSFFGIHPTGKQLDLTWKLVLEGLDVNAILDHADAPDEFIWQMTWIEKAAGTRDFVTFSPEWTEYGVRWALANHNGRPATPIIHIGAYSTVAEGGTDFSYGYDHTLTVAEHLAALKAAAKGGAIHFESYAWHTYEDFGLWDALSSFWSSEEYNAIVAEVQWNDGGTWRPIGRQAWFNSRSGLTQWLAHFDRMSEDQLRIYFYPSCPSAREMLVPEVEFRTHSIQDDDTIWGGIDHDTVQAP